MTNAFFDWMDRTLSGPIPAGTVGFHFNLYEGADSVHIQLIGTDAFNPGQNPATDYWPGTQTFTTGESVFKIPFVTAGSDWQQWLATCTEWARSNIRDGANAEILRRSKGVGMGFVDGDMHIIWQPSAR